MKDKLDLIEATLEHANYFKLNHIVKAEIVEALTALAELRDMVEENGRLRKALEKAQCWFDKALQGNIMSAPDAGVVKRKIDEALEGGHKDD